MGVLITSSRRPGHRTRLLCRELARVLNATYIPRGSKTVKKLALLAGEFGHNRVMVVNGIGRQPRELRFFDAAGGCRWLDAQVELGRVELQRDLGQKVKLEGTKICAEGDQARKFTDFIREVLDLPASEELPTVGAVALITSNDELKLYFQARPSSETIGPILQITGFGQLHG